MTNPVIICRKIPFLFGLMIHRLSSFHGHLWFWEVVRFQKKQPMKAVEDEGEKKATLRRQFLEVADLTNLIMTSLWRLASIQKWLPDISWYLWASTIDNQRPPMLWASDQGVAEVWRDPVLFPLKAGCLCETSCSSHLEQVRMILQRSSKMWNPKNHRTLSM